MRRAANPACVFAIAAIAWIVCLAGSALAAAQSASDRTVWDGVFTDAQAARGKAAFETSCGRCHNNALSGSERGPALTGNGFWSHWDNDTLNALFTKVRDTMPAGGIESVTDATKLDIVSYILSANGAASGSRELTLEPAALETIAVVKQGSARGEVSNFNLVEVVGCLRSAGNRQWTLTSATDPVVTKEETPTPASLATAGARPLGTLEFQLVSVVPAYEAERHAGQKVAARGLIFRSASDHLLNLTALRPTGAACR